MKVLVTGGSGYLGQFVVRKLAAEHEALFDANGPFDAVVNTAAISQPGFCQQDPDRARAINIPTALLAALQTQQASSGVEAVLVHLSTDQVYDGSRPLWSESDATEPVNEYGRSKVDAETAIREQWPKHIILRSSIIYGPQSPVPVSRPLFVQFVEEALREQKPCKFFSDEFRSPIYVADLAAVIAHAITSPPPAAHAQHGQHTQRTLNAGGPDRLSRLGIAEAVAAHCGHSTRSVEAAASASVVRAAPSPLDISMDSGRLAAWLPFALTPFAVALRELFPAAP